MDYQENLRQKAEELIRLKYPQTYTFAKKWQTPSKEGLWPSEYYKKQLEYMIEQMLPIVEKSLQWAAETAHAVNGPQMSKGIIDAMLEELGVIPPQTPKSDISCSGE